MKVTLQNIGLIQNTEILLDGITLIVGNNSTGKVQSEERSIYMECA